STRSLHDALPIFHSRAVLGGHVVDRVAADDELGELTTVGILTFQRAELVAFVDHDLHFDTVQFPLDAVDLVPGGSAPHDGVAVEVTVEPFGSHGVAAATVG